MSSAFDTIHHNILTSRLQDEFGVTGTCLQWILSYVRDRSSVVRNGSTVLEQVMSICGVLGTLLFYIYVSPVGRLIRHFNVDLHQYADDITLYTAITCDSQASNQLSRCTAALQLWFWSNGLLLNPDKSVAAIVGTNQRLSRPGWPSHVKIAGADIFLDNKL